MGTSREHGVPQCGLVAKSPGWEFVFSGAGQQSRAGTMNDGNLEVRGAELAEAEIGFQQENC